VHAVEWRSMSVEPLRGAPPEAATALAAQVEHFLAFTEWGSEGGRYPTLDAATDWLRANQPQPTGPAVLTWNDGRLGNMLFSDARLTGVLDWELVTVGPPEVDLAWCLWHDHFSAACLASVMAGRRVARLDGAPDLAQGADWYAAASGHEPADLDWYVTWSAFRMAVYLMRHGKGLIATGVAPPESRVDHVNIASIELARMLDLDPPH
jgi:aminoglycoside phosphotransferase (APT) family kinase protein